MLKILSLIMSVSLPALVLGDLVHVYEATEIEGVVTQISDRSLITGMPWETQTAPVKAGYIFTHWTISTAQEFVNRDAWGRAVDVAVFKLYEDTTLTAHYVPASRDADGDGVADGYELYWYGNLAQNGASDTDGDGWTFAEELATGTNPLMADSDVDGPVRYADGELLTYNPFGYSSYVFRSEPEGVLFATASDIVKAGTYLTSEALGTFTATTAKFAYWTVNGVPQRDAWGRAIDVIAFNMPTTSVEVVAVTETDETRRQQLYWYGRTDVAMDSDTDGDGWTFAEELANGTNPLMADSDVDGPVRYADGELLQYNPWNIQPYTFRSEPEGVLFPTTNDYARAGTWMSSTLVGTYGSGSVNFAYWKVNGVEQRDAWGRAIDTIAFSMPTNAVEIVAVVETDDVTRQQLYWYGRTDVAMESDTDGDGWTFAEELANGTNPLMAEEDVEGPVRYADGELIEANLQPYEQIVGTVVDGNYQELFTSNWTANDETSVTFDGAVTPTAVDLDGDGRFDLVVESSTGERRVFLNTGAVGNPQFAEVAWNPAWLTALTGAKVTSIAELNIDTPVLDATGYARADVDKDGVPDLLVSDKDGRVWFYKGIGTQGATEATEYVLQNKVWGGSFDGFAKDLTISAVDWDDDGDVDLVCGTSDGKLMLLNDPRIGRPVNVLAEAGATSVVLAWDPSVNSRVRGYGIYRGVDSNNFDKVVNLWPLPRYRDEPSVVRDYWYRVTGMSRFYTTGNSTPVESESQATDAVFVQFAPSVWLNDTSSFTDTNVEMVVSINNSMGLSAQNLRFVFDFDSTVLEPREVKTTGLTADLKVTDTKSTGRWVVTSSGGVIKTGSGMFLKLGFYVKPVKGVSSTAVVLSAATVRTVAGNPVDLNLPKSGIIELAERQYDPAVVSVALGDAKVDTCTEFAVPVSVTTSEKLTAFRAMVAFDEEVLELQGVEGGVLTRDAGTSSWLVTTEGGDFTLKFYAKDQHTVSATEVRLGSIRATDLHEHQVSADEAVASILIHDAHPLVPAVVSLSTQDCKVDTLTEFAVPFAVSSTEPLTSGRFTVTYDPSVLDHAGSNGTIEVEAAESFSLNFTAKDQHTVTKTEVRLTAASVIDRNGFTVSPSVPVVANVLIHDAHPLVPAKVTMTLADVSAKTETDFEMVLSIATTEALTSLDLALSYDTNLLTLLSGQQKFTDGVPTSAVYRFHAKENHTIGRTVVTVTPKDGVDHNGLAAELPASVSGTVVLADSNPWQPATVALSLSGAKIDTLTEFELPVKVTSNEVLTDLRYTVSVDSAALEYLGANPVVLNGTVASTQKLRFRAKDQHTITRTTVRLSDARAVDNHGLVANAIADTSAEVVIHDANPPIPAQVAVKVGGASAKTKTTFSVALAVTTTKPLASLSFGANWNSAALELKGVSGATASGQTASGVTLSCTGSVPKEIVLTFYAKEQHTITSTDITLTSGQAKCTEGLTATVALTGGKILLTDSNPPVAPKMIVGAWSASFGSGKSGTIPIGATSDGALSEISFTFEWDAKLLTYNGAENAKTDAALASNRRQVTFAANGEENLYKLSFTAATLTDHMATNAFIYTTAARATGSNGLAAQVTNKLPVKSTVLIVRTVERYGPGDIDGDGKLTNGDLEKLENYIKYLSLIKMNPSFASRYASWNLTGNALKAADVNLDGKVDVSDVSVLKQLILEAEGLK